AVTEKAGLLTDVQAAQTLLNAQEDAAAALEAAQQAVEGLFADYSTKAALAANVDQDAINAAKAKAEALDDAVTEKAGLLTDVQAAQTLLNAQEELGTLTSDPTAVTESRSYWGNIILSLDGDTFKSFDRNNVVFGGDFAGLNLGGYNTLGGNTQVRLESITGNLVRDTGVGTITIKGAGLNGGSDLTVSITVNSAP
ncbi:hypothetical protein EDM59_01880, partial [Brevibacillus nitrificans]